MSKCLALVAIGMTIGCGGQPQSAATPAKPTPSYTYEVRSVNGLSKGKAPEFSVSGGKTAVSVKGSRLTVNGRDFGELNDGDSIVVDENGRITVNGSERTSVVK